MTQTLASGGTFYMPKANVTVTATYLATGTTYEKITTVSSEEDLTNLMLGVNYGGVDYSGETVTLTSDIALTSPMLSIGTADNPFSGTFDGNGKTISGLSISSSEQYVGLFGYVSGAIKDLTIQGAVQASGTDSSTNYYAGLAVGYLTYSGCVTQVQTKGTIASTASYVYVGGVVGYSDGNVSYCYNLSAVSVNSDGGDVGGIVGCSETGTLSNCGNYGSIAAVVDNTTASRVGGVAGNTNIDLTNCFNYGNISGTFAFGGGDVGYSRNNRTLTNCYNRGTITNAGTLNANGKNDGKAAEVRVGGIIGTANYAASTLTLINCYSTKTPTSTITISTGTSRNTSIVASNGLETNSDDYGQDFGSEYVTKIHDSAIALTNCANESGGTYSVDGGTTTYTMPSILNSTSASSFVTAANSNQEAAEWELGSDNLPTLKESGVTVEGKVAVTFSVTPSNADVQLFDENGSAITDNGDGTYTVEAGKTYSYIVTANGYVTETDSFVPMSDLTVTITMTKAAVVVFEVAPALAEFTLETAGGTPAEADKIDSSDLLATYTYTLYSGVGYVYSAYAEDYNGTTREFVAVDGTTIEVELTKKGSAGDTIWGDGNGGGEDYPYEITAGGSYYIGDGATGTVYIRTKETVTLVGTGVGTRNAYEDLYIDCTDQPSNLVLQDVYISNNSGDANTIDFSGRGNTLTFDGICILDQNSGANGYAMIHVNQKTSLTISGGTAYLYKREQGAGIGGNGGADGENGQSSETNGTITIENATLFIKGSKQGALIGAGAQSTGQTPGNITISNSEVYLVANARGAAIGGSAGSTGASDGGTFTITDSTVTINVNYTGSAIGGGGYDVGNDADGGRLYVSNSSIRTYIDENAVNYWSSSEVTERGVNNNAAITADIYTGSGEKAYLLVFDTSELPSSSSYLVKADGSTVYSGGLHEWQYVNYAKVQAAETTISYTIDNWASLDDPCLYLYLTGEDHVLSVNGETFIAQFNGSGFDLVTSSSLYTTTVASQVATTTIDSTALTAYLSTLSSGSQLLIDVTSEVGSKSVYESIVQMTPADAAAIGSAGVSLKIESPVADIALTAAGMKALGARTGDEVTIGASQESDGIHIDVAVDGTALSTITGGLTVTLPVSSVTKNTILVLVDEDGTETELTNAVFGTSSVTVQVSGSCVLKVTEKTTTIPSTTTIRNGLATTTIDSDALADILKLVEEGDQLLIEADISTSESRDVYSTITELDSDDVEAMADAEVSLLVSSFIADILLPTDALEDIAAEKGDTVTIIATEQTNGIAITVAVDGETMDSITGGIQVTLPVSNVTDNTVLVLINADGTETVLEDAEFSRYSVTVWVDGSCVLALKEKSTDVDLEVTTVIENGVATTTIDSENLAAVLETIEAGTTLVITADIPDGVDVTEANTVLTRGDVRAMVEAEVDLKVSTPLADVYLSTQSLTSIAGDESLADEHEVVITTSERTSGTYIGVTVDGKTMGTVDGGILATLPAENASASSVLVLVDPYGEQTIIRKTALGDDALTALLSGSCTVKAIENPVYFADVTNTAWYTDAVAYVSARELFTGIGNDLFDPTGTMTRSMLVTVLHRLEDNPDAAQLSSYDDVAHDQWYSDAIHWADENGIVSGYGNGQFGTTDSVTREQMATILYRYVQYLGLDVSTTGSLSRFSDGGDTSDWAEEAMRWAVGAGILQGNDEGTLNPLGTASRAEVATMLQRLINLIVQ